MQTPSPTQLAKLVDISVPHASSILSGKRKASPQLARLIEEKAGIPRHQLRPDIFDPPTPTAPLSGGTAGDLAPFPVSPQATASAGAGPSSAPAAFSGEGAGGVIPGGAA